MTRIQLDGYGYIDIMEDTYFPLNFNIQDLTKPETTPANYSKDIKIVGSKEVNKILSHAYDVNISDGSYDVNKRVKCTVIQNGANIFEDAYFQLIGVEINNGVITYNGRVKSDLMSFFTDIKNKELTELNIYTPDDFHYLTKTNIKNTFNNTVNDRWKYMMCANLTNNVFSVKDFKPAIYLKTYFDAIHAENGWEYEVLNPEKIRFDKLIIPNTNIFNSDDKKSEQNTFYQNKGFTLEELNNSNGVNGIHQQRKFAKPFPIDYTGDVINPNNSFDFSTQQYTPQVYGNYEIIIDTDYEVYYTFDNAAILRCTDTNNLFVDFYFEFTVRNANGVDRWYQTQSFRLSHYENDTFSAGTHLVRSGSGRFSTSLQLHNGDRIIAWRVMTLESTDRDISEMKNHWNASWVRQSSSSVGVGYNPSIETTNWEMQVIPEVNYSWGVPIYLNEYIPKKIKQRDLIKSIVDGFKLITYVDPNNENKIIYELRDDYYDRGEEKDWTDKLALDKTITLKWLQDKQAKNKIFTYKEDKDSTNTVYQDNVKETYGQLNFHFENEYNVGEDKLELIFSPTPILHNKFSNLYLPAIVADAEDLNIRLLLDNGVNSNGYYFIKDADNEINWNIVENYYPSILHFDDAERPSFDLNFGKAKYYFYNSWNDTTYNSLFQYHRRTLNQITNGRVMTAFFDLTELDILKLNLNDRIYIGGEINSWWNINKIIDYNANGKQLTKVELVTIDDGQSINLTKGIVINEAVKDITDRPIKLDNTNPIINDAVIGINKEYERVGNTVIGNTSVVVGLENWVSNNTTSVVVGDRNIINGKNNVIIGKNISDEGYSNKLLVGNNVKAKQEYPVTIQEVNIGNDINIGETTFGPNGITYNSSYIENGYLDDGYFESMSATAGFEYDETTDNVKYKLDADTIEINGDVELNKLKINDIGTTTPIGNLGYDADGNVVVSSAGGGNVESVTGVNGVPINNTNPSNPIVGLQDRLPISYTTGTQKLPSWYLTNTPRSYTQEVKERNSLGLSSSFASDHWIGLATTTLHGTFADAPPTQVATVPSSGRMFKRYALTTTTWSNWEEVSIQDYSPVIDTRSTNENPQWYFENYSKKTIYEFKLISTVGLGTIFTSGSYCNVKTITQWTDSSGGYPIQIATNPADGKMVKRYGTSNTVWSSWVEF